MSYTICNVYSLPSTYASSSLRAQLYDSGNSAVGSEISTGFYKRTGSTTIFAHALTVPDSHVGWCDVYVDGASSVIIACIPINPQEVENANVKTSTRGTSTLTTSDIDARLAAYDAPTKAELDSAVAPLATQTSVDTLAGYVDTEVASILAAVDTEITAIKAKTDNLPATPAATTDIPGTAAIATAIFAVAVETGHDLTTVLRAIYAAIRGRSVADDADDPTTITYYAPDNSTARVTHTLTDTERTVA